MSEAPVEIPPNRKALWSFWMGLIGGVCCQGGLLFGIPTIVLGHLALREIKASEPEPPGKGFAMIGIIFGYISITYSLIVLAYFIYCWVNGIPLIIPGYPAPEAAPAG